jgi:hypothetical protein
MTKRLDSPWSLNQSPKWAGSVALLLLVGACARMPAMSIPNPLDFVVGPSTVHVEVTTQKAQAWLVRGGQPLRIALAEVADARPGKLGRKVGVIKATVTNMVGGELTLDRSPVALLDHAVRVQLLADGFKLTDPKEQADFALSATVKDFTLNIVGTDEMSIVADVTLRDGKSGEVVWAGTVTEHSDRFAGVSGNSRETIATYLGDSVAAIAGKLSAVVSDSLRKAHPHSIELSKSPAESTLAGVTTTQSVGLRELKPMNVAPLPAAPAASIVVTPSPAPINAAGYVLVSSVPARAKIYVDDIYHGLTPMKVELSAGVNQMHFKLDGFRSTSEKVAVRRGETTELEIKFQK